MFDKSERTFNIPASLVFNNNKDGSGASINDKKKDSEKENIKNKDSIISQNNKDKSDHSKVTKSLSSSPTPATKPPIPAPRAINNQEKPKSVGTLMIKCITKVFLIYLL